jgi:glutamyl/glutaminyl-tRNA synthetase
VVNAIWTWGIARAAGGRVLLRIEDHDRGRCRPEFEAAILRDLAWLGLEADLGPVRQSDRSGRYAAALERLAGVTPVYGCACSRKTIATAAGGPVEGEETRYPGTCREKALGLGAGLGVRAKLPEEEITFHDLRLGPIRQNPAHQCGDLLLRDQPGSWTYQWCVTVDDLEDGIDLVIRGEDILESTGRQILLGRMLGRGAPAAFLHHPLIHGADGRKLGKREGSEGVEALRLAGVQPETVLGRAAWLSGLLESEEPVRADDLARLFTER